MSSCRVLSVLGVSAVLGALTLAFVPLPQDMPAATPAGEAAALTDDANGTYRIDPVHSTVIFRVKHMNVSWSYGRFNEMNGSFVLDVTHPEKSSVELTIPVQSIDTANSKRDQHLLSPDFFSAAEFPEISFKSDKVRKLNADLLEVSGTLSLHGESRPLTVQVELAGTAPAGGRRPAMAGFESTFTIKRSDFGMGGMLDSLGDEIRITLSVEAGQAG
jgi:polyisoprenoid-binding protein YceI